MAYKMEVTTDASGKWYGNARRFETAQEAEEHARDLASRWLLVRDWRVVEISNEESDK